MSNLKIPISEKDHSRGAGKPQLQIVEYGDFQCPHCGIAEPTMHKILQHFGEAVSITFRNFPLTEIHPMAYPAAEAAEAAAMQNKYWEMHDFIFRNQRALSKEMLVDEAKNLGLDVEKFVTDCKSNEITDKIDADFESGAISGVNGTPSFFINGIKFDGGAQDLYALIAESASN